MVTTADAEHRATIVDGATEIFARAGYRATKVSDVAARVGSAGCSGECRLASGCD